MKLKKNSTVYIAGKMRGEKFYGFPAFDKAKRHLFEEGYLPISPADLDRGIAGFDAMKLPMDTDWNEIPEGFDFQACVDRDIEAVIGSDAIYMLSGWEDSKGARAEKALAEWLGKEVMYENPDLALPTRNTDDTPIPDSTLDMVDAIKGYQPGKVIWADHSAIQAKIKKTIRQFDTGATRNSLDGKLQYSRFLDPEVFKVYCVYMESHRVQADGSTRDPDNWKRGISEDVYMDSLYRHVTNLWGVYNGYERIQPETGEPETKKELLCAIMFNVIGYLYELNKEEK